MFIYTIFYYIAEYLNLEDSKKIKGSVLCEHLKSIDFETRNIKFVEKAPIEDLEFSQVLFNLCLE